MSEKKYRILIVDENTEQIEEFHNFFENIGDTEFEIFSLDKLEEDGQLIEYVVENNIDSIAFDYKLMENNSTAFSQNGDAYQNMLLSHFENFPTFIITNNSDDAKYMNADPFKIISKSIVLFDSENEDQKQEAASLLDKIKQSIDKYKDNLTAVENELFALIERQNNGEALSPDEISRIIELDNKLENSISKKSKIPPEWKSPAGIEAIVNLVSKSEDILAELKKLNNG